MNPTKHEQPANRSQGLIPTRKWLLTHKTWLFLGKAAFLTAGSRPAVARGLGRAASAALAVQALPAADAAAVAVRVCQYP